MYCRRRAAGSEGNIVVFGRRAIRFGCRRSVGWSGGSAGGFGTRRSSGAAFRHLARIHELKSLEHDAELALFLVGLLVVPGIQTQAPLDEDRPPFLEILSNRFGLATERIDVHESHFFLLLPAFICPGAINRQAELRDGRA